MLFCPYQHINPRPPVSPSGWHSQQLLTCAKYHRASPLWCSALLLLTRWNSTLLLHQLHLTSHDYFSLISPHANLLTDSIPPLSSESSRSFLQGERRVLPDGGQHPAAGSHRWGLHCLASSVCPREGHVVGNCLWAGHSSRCEGSLLLPIFKLFIYLLKSSWSTILC